MQDTFPICKKKIIYYFNKKKETKRWQNTHSGVNSFLKKHLFFPSTCIFIRCLQGVPHYRGFWLMYAKVGDFCFSRGPPTVPLMQISRNAFFFKTQNPRKVEIPSVPSSNKKSSFEPRDWDQ